MNIYKISCYSKCGSYFAEYLQYVTIVAENEAQALEIVEKAHGEDFVNEQRDIILLASNIINGMILEVHEDSDY